MDRLKTFFVLNVRYFLSSNTHNDILSLDMSQAFLLELLYFSSDLEKLASGDLPLFYILMTVLNKKS